MNDGEKNVALFRGSEIAVRLQGSEPDGPPRTELVKVLQLPIRLFPALRRALTNEVAQVALYCGRDEKWAEQLEPASHELVIETGESINGGFFGRWAARERKREELLPKVDNEQIAKILEAVARGNPEFLKSLLPTGSPNSAPGPA
jgi:hypothetical protein